MRSPPPGATRSGRARSSVNCPALGFAQLAPGATVSGTGTWNQDKPNADRRVSLGKYTLIVDNKHFSFPIKVSP